MSEDRYEPTIRHGQRVIWFDCNLKTTGLSVTRNLLLVGQPSLKGMNTKLVTHRLRILPSLRDPTRWHV